MSIFIQLATLNFEIEYCQSKNAFRIHNSTCLIGAGASAVSSCNPKIPFRGQKRPRQYDPVDTLPLKSCFIILAFASTD